MSERSSQDFERKVTGLLPRLALPEAPYHDREIAAGWFRLHRMLTFNPNHDSRGRFDFGGGDDGNAAPTTSPTWPPTGRSGLNVLQAISEIQNATSNTSGSQSQCAFYVREALKAGGVDLKDHPVLADRYGSYLKQSGFVPLSPNPDPKYDAKPGDIAVFGRLTDKGNGHIQMFDGHHWVFDFRKSGFWSSHAYINGDRGYTIYRP
jgi:hypothetical protein